MKSLIKIFCKLKVLTYSYTILIDILKSFSIIPATSVASESAFSVAGVMKRKERSFLSTLPVFNKFK